jgi:hypothetical protein
MSEETFVKYKKHATQHQAQKRSMYQQSAHYWNAINLKTYDFVKGCLWHKHFQLWLYNLLILMYLAHKVSLLVEKVTKTDVIRFYEKYLLPSSGRSKLSVHLRASSCISPTLIDLAPSPTVTTKHHHSPCHLSPSTPRDATTCHPHWDDFGHHDYDPVYGRTWWEEDTTLDVDQSILSPLLSPHIAPNHKVTSSSHEWIHLPHLSSSPTLPCQAEDVKHALQNSDSDACSLSHTIHENSQTEKKHSLRIALSDTLNSVELDCVSTKPQSHFSQHFSSQNRIKCLSAFKASLTLAKASDINV